ncbi:MAG TPA: glycosyltransferase family 2 protein [Microlunatus sp.]|nr:glycosyltransferase family 2 protein [Microlunatus sp.]
MQDTTTTPLVSVIVPAKDQEAHIADCLTSLVGQLPDPESLQVIMVDDGSGDATGEIVRGFTDRLPGLVVLRNEQPVGLGSARNQGLDAATGRYLAYLDGDDWLARGHLAGMVEVIADLGVDFVRTDHVQVTGGRRVVHRAPEARRHRVLDPRGSILPTSTSTMVDYCFAWAGIFDRRIADLLRFPEGLFTAEDRSWCWRLHLEAGSFAVAGPPGICYRRGVAGSLTQIVDRRQLDFLPAFERVFDLVRADRDADLWWPKAARMFLAVLARHVGRRKRMTTDDRGLLQSRSRQVLAQVPRPVLLDAYQAGKPDRRALLAPLVLGRTAAVRTRLHRRVA